MKKLPFNLLLDKYRKELINAYTYSKQSEHFNYWILRSNDTHNRLIEMYNETNHSRR